MSNHAIGYDLGNVLEGIMNLYDEKELSETAVFKINDMLHDDFEDFMQDNTPSSVDDIGENQNII